jgi:hypothetical protein
MVRKTLGLVLIASHALVASGCTGWRVRNTPAAELLAEKPLQAIRIVTVDSIAVTLHQPRILGDSVTGHPTPNAVERRTISLRDIKTVATKYTDIGKTLFAAAAIVAGVAVYGLLQSLNGTQP